MIIVTQQDKNVIQCTECRSHSLPEDTPNRALETARHDGFYVIVTPTNNYHACSYECLLAITDKLTNQRKAWQVLMPYSTRRLPLEYLETEEYEDFTYTQEFDEFTDADPGL